MASTKEGITEKFEWSEPPHNARRQGERFGVWARRVAPLDEEPGRWALVLLCDAQETATTIVGRLATGKYQGFDHTRYEAMWAPHPSMDDKWGIWARRLPDPEPEPDPDF